MAILRTVCILAVLAASDASLRGWRMASSGMEGARPQLPAAFRARILHFVDDPFNHESGSATEEDTFQYFEDGVLAVNATGHIDFVGKFVDYIAKKDGLFTIVNLTNAQGEFNLIMPGFLDAHVHFPQDGMIGHFGAELSNWLQDYTFPAEVRFRQECGSPVEPTDANCSSKRLQYARRRADQFLDDLLRVGTTTVAAYATIFEESVAALFDAAYERNMRIITGRMGQNVPTGSEGDGKYLYDNAETFTKESERLIENYHGKGRLLYGVTPRYAPQCFQDELNASGSLVEKYWDYKPGNAISGVYLQTHLAENYDTINMAATMHRNLSCSTSQHRCQCANEVNDSQGFCNMSYTQIYEHFGLLTSRSIMGHVIHLSDFEWELLGHYGSTAAHNPTSNLFLGSGFFNMRAALSHAGVKVGIGTDVGAGTSLSILRTLNEAYKVFQIGKGYMTHVMPSGHFPNGHTVSVVSDSFLNTDGTPMFNDKASRSIPAPEQGVVPNNIALSAAKGFYMATLGTAKALSLDSVLGNFEAGKEADFVEIDVDGSWITKRRNTFDDRSVDATKLALEQLFTLAIQGDDRNIVGTYVMGTRRYPQ